MIYENIAIDAGNHTQKVMQIEAQTLSGNKPVFAVLKRLFDITFSLVLCVLLLWWLLPVLFLLIKLESKGPAFFIQKRTGFHNKIFSCIKFRTMKTNDAADLLQALDNDKRITRIGHFLRNTNLD